MEDFNLKSEFGNSCRGLMVASSVGGTVTGKGGNFLVVDDPLNPLEALSDTERERANTWFSQTFSSRLDDKRKGSIVIIMQRLHEQDLTGYLMQNGNDWTQLRLPAIAEESEEIRFPLSKKTIHREKGDVLWPAREDNQQLNPQREIMGDYAFFAQYQQQPVPLGGAMFKTEWLNRTYTTLPTGTVLLLSVDASFKDSSESSFVVIQTWGRHGMDNYLVDQVRAKMGFTETLDAIRAARLRRKNVMAILIEDKANGEAIIQTLRVEFPGVIPVSPQTSKEARAASVTPLWQSGSVLLPEAAPWKQEFLHEIKSFPGSKYKDQVDCMSQSLNYLENIFGPRSYLQENRKPIKSHFIFRPGMRVR
jgi:predicted phage terminase large subunit-like protein